MDAFCRKWLSICHEWFPRDSTQRIYVNIIPTSAIRDKFNITRDIFCALRKVYVKLYLSSCAFRYSNCKDEVT